MPTTRHRSISFARISALAGNTLIGLTRLKAFYFLLLFALLLIGTAPFLAHLTFQQELQILKDVSLGAMNIFSSLLAIVATAQLLPRDLEERTICTILAKPVPRSEYLLGKLIGVLLLLALSILAMSLLFLGLLFVRQEMLVREIFSQAANLPDTQTEETVRTLRTASFNSNLLPGILLIYLKAGLLAALTLFVSTFATSNIFSIVIMVFVYFIGHLQAIARTYWLESHSADWVARAFLGLVALLFPDLQLFNLVDDMVAGTAISSALFAKTALLGFIYISVYFFFAWISFRGREL